MTLTRKIEKIKDGITDALADAKALPEASSHVELVQDNLNEADAFIKRAFDAAEAHKAFLRERVKEHQKAARSV
jgi:hypothetical protein